MTDVIDPVEVMARGICAAWGYFWDHDPEDDQTCAPDGQEVDYCPRPSQAQFIEAARAALTAASEAGWVLVPRETLARTENLCRVICQNVTEEETSTHVAVSWEYGTAARILSMATRLRAMIVVASDAGKGE